MTAVRGGWCVLAVLGAAIALPRVWPLPAVTGLWLRAVPVACTGACPVGGPCPPCTPAFVIGWLPSPDLGGGAPLAGYRVFVGNSPDQMSEVGAPGPGITGWTLTGQAADARMVGVAARYGGRTGPVSTMILPPPGEFLPA